MSTSLGSIPPGSFQYTWASGQAGPAWHGGHRAEEARRALRAVPHRPAGLAFGPSMGLWVIFRVVLAREARQKWRAVPVHSPLRQKHIKNSKYISQIREQI
jgi:hypothetical protein